MGTCTLSEESNSAIFIIVSLLNGGQLLEKEFAPKEANPSSRVDLIMEGFCHPGKQTRNNDSCIPSLNGGKAYSYIRVLPCC